jgi:hypothetical protein
VLLNILSTVEIGACSRSRLLSSRLSHVVSWSKVIIKAPRRFRHMVSVHTHRISNSGYQNHVIFSSPSFPVSRSPRGHACIYHPSIYPRCIFRHGCLPVLDTRTISLVTTSLCGSPESRHLTIKFYMCFCTNVYSIVPVVGMLCANAITGISVSLGYILKELGCAIFPSRLLCINPHWMLQRNP